MALAIKPLSCNGACRSCYEARIVAAGGVKPYDVEAAIRRLQEGKETRPPSIHGGEPLLLGHVAMERLLSYCFERWGSSGIQTNGLLIDADWIGQFKRYNTSVGISIDGDTARLNMGRWNATEASRAQAEAGTARAMQAIRDCVAAGLRVSVIVVLRRYNAAPGRLDELKRFLLALEEIGIRDIRTNPGIVFEPADRAEEELSNGDLGSAFAALADLCLGDSGRMWQPYRDVVDLLLGFRDATCIFTGCDPHATGSEIPILADGGLGNCLKSSFALDGVAALRASKATGARQEALRVTPQEDGGCAGCEYWGVCRGGCPGEGIDNDWRNRTRFCSGFRDLFRHVEQRLLGLLPNLNMQSQHAGNIGRAGVLLNLSTDAGSSWRKDHRHKPTEAPVGSAACSRDHGDSHGDEHGDRPHGDHTDQAAEGK